MQKWKSVLAKTARWGIALWWLATGWVIMFAVIGTLPYAIQVVSDNPWWRWLVSAYVLWGMITFLVCVWKGLGYEGHRRA